jgi:hypothetical protein
MVAVVAPHAVAKPAITRGAAELLDPRVLIGRHGLAGELPADPIGFFGQYDAVAEAGGAHGRGAAARAAAHNKNVAGGFVHGTETDFAATGFSSCRARLSMKLGLLVIAPDENNPALGREDGGPATALADFLEADGHRTVPAERIAASSVAAANEATRLARADVDGLVLCLVGPTNTRGMIAAASDALMGRAVVEAAVRGGVPVLLWAERETDLPLLLSAAGALAEFGVPCGRALGGLSNQSVQAAVRNWLALHAPDERRCGEEAARKLYGQRCWVANPASVLRSDASRWLTQFGVSLVPPDPILRACHTAPSATPPLIRPKRRLLRHWFLG